MKPEITTYVRYRLDRAQETLRDANLLLDNGSLHSAVNRLYYACFHAVSALLLAQGHQSSKHAGIAALFDRHWIATGGFPLKWAGSTANSSRTDNTATIATWPLSMPEMSRHGRIKPASGLTR